MPLPIIYTWAGPPASGKKSGDDVLGPMLYAQQHPEEPITFFSLKDHVGYYQELFQERGNTNIRVMSIEDYLWEEDEVQAFDYISKLKALSQKDGIDERDRALYDVTIKAVMQFVLPCHQACALFDTNVIPVPNKSVDLATLCDSYTLPMVDEEPDIWGMLSQGPPKDKMAVKRLNHFIEKTYPLMLNSPIDRMKRGEVAIDSATKISPVTYAECKPFLKHAEFAFRESFYKMYFGSHHLHQSRQTHFEKCAEAAADPCHTTVLLPVVDCYMSFNNVLPTDHIADWQGEEVTLLHMAIFNKNIALIKHCLKYPIDFSKQIIKKNEGEPLTLTPIALLMHLDTGPNTNEMMKVMIAKYIEQHFDGSASLFLDTLSQRLQAKSAPDVTQSVETLLDYLSGLGPEEKLTGPVSVELTTLMSGKPKEDLVAAASFKE